MRSEGAKSGLVSGCANGLHLSGHSGKAIREKRRRPGLTQEPLADKAHLHPNYLGRIERGEVSVSLKSLRRIAKALGRKR